MLLCLRRSPALMMSVWRPSQSSNLRVALSTFITRQRYDQGQAKSTDEKANETAGRHFFAKTVTPNASPGARQTIRPFWRANSYQHLRLALDHLVSEQPRHRLACASSHRVD